MALSSAKIIVRRFDGRMAFVPEGRCDRSLARSAWESATPKEPSRRVRSDSCRCADRFDDWSDAIPKAKTEKICCMISCLLGLAAPDHIVGRCPRQRGPVPEGPSKSLSVPQIFVVETEPRHQQATARRMLLPLQKRGYSC